MSAKPTKPMKRSSATIWQVTEKDVLVSSVDEDLNERSINRQLIGFRPRPGDLIRVDQVWDREYEEYGISQVAVWRSVARGGRPWERYKVRAEAAQRIERAIVHLQASKRLLDGVAGNRADLAQVSRMVEALLLKWEHLDRQLERDALMPRVRSDWYEYSASVHASSDVRDGSQWNCGCPACTAARRDGFIPLFLRENRVAAND